MYQRGFQAEAIVRSADPRHRLHVYVIERCLGDRRPMLELGLLGMPHHNFTRKQPGDLRKSLQVR